MNAIINTMLRGQTLTCAAIALCCWNFVLPSFADAGGMGRGAVVPPLEGLFEHSAAKMSPSYKLLAYTFTSALSSSTLYVSECLRKVYFILWLIVNNLLITMLIVSSVPSRTWAAS